jgi:hypothetical protein
MPGMDLTNLVSQLMAKFALVDFLLDAALLTTVVTFIGKLSWTAASELVWSLYRWSLRKPQKHKVVVAKTKIPFEKGVAKVRCLVVRYGTDQYIEHMASDREKYDGRLLNEVIPIRVIRTGDAVSFEVDLPVHKRLGTQFKCYVEVPKGGPVAEIKKFLTGLADIHEVSESSSLDGGNRIFFLIKKFATVTSIDGFNNNMCFPH